MSVSTGSRSNARFYQCTIDLIRTEMLFLHGSIITYRYANAEDLDSTENVFGSSRPCHSRLDSRVRPVASTRLRLTDSCVYNQCTLEPRLFGRGKPSETRMTPLLAISGIMAG
jgi:hypothetical protein